MKLCLKRIIKLMGFFVCLLVGFFCFFFFHFQRGAKALPRNVNSVRTQKPEGSSVKPLALRWMYRKSFCVRPKNWTSCQYSIDILKILSSDLETEMESCHVHNTGKMPIYTIQQLLLLKSSTRVEYSIKK